MLLECVGWGWEEKCISHRLFSFDFITIKLNFNNNLILIYYVKDNIV